MLRRYMLLPLVLAFTPLAAGPVAAQTAPAPAAALSTEATDIGTLIDNPATKAIVDKYMPGFSSNDQITMARAMTLRQIQTFAPDQITDEALTKIDADLAKLKK